MATANAVNVNFKLDANDKKRMEWVCSELGITMSAAFSMFAKKVARECRIPFKLEIDPFYSDSNMNYLRSRKKAIEEGRAHFAEHDLIEVEDDA